MSDRTYVEFRFKYLTAEQVEALRTCLGENQVHESTDKIVERGSLVLEFDELDQGGVDESRALKEARIPFLSYWSEGDSYLAGREAFDGHDSAEVQLGKTGDVVIKYDKVADQPSAEHLAEIRKYFRLEKQLTNQS